ncbi:hypothetical protein C8F01DRAFT_1271548 [Mycena amicta]|nr:hypothetical protein C8F01DRAFT_1271548 [Mycena amicta]
MAAIPLTIASMDQSFKALKYIARLDGVKAFGSLLTFKNHLEQIRQMILTPTKHLHHAEGPLRDIQKLLHQHGHPPISMVWTDNVKADRKFMERVVPSLRVQASSSSTAIQTPQMYPPVQVPALNSLIASSPWLIEEACATILSSIRDLPLTEKVFVGFALEWDWRASQHGHFPASLMQIATGDSLHLLQIYHLSKPSTVPKSLKAILFSDQIIKVGHHVQGNLDLLSHLWDLEPPTKASTGQLGWLELGILARSQHLIANPSLSLPRIAEEVLGRTTSTRDELRSSEWCTKNLSSDQIEYAVENAWVPLYILKAIREKPPTGARLSRIGLPNEKVTLRNGNTAITHAMFLEQMTRFPVSESDMNRGYIKLSGTRRALIRITKIIASNFISQYHQKTLGELGPVPFDMVVDLSSLVSGLDPTCISPDNAGASDAGIADDNNDGMEADAGVQSDSSADSESDSESDSDSDDLDGESNTLSSSMHTTDNVSPVPPPLLTTSTSSSHASDNDYEQFMEGPLKIHSQVIPKIRTNFQPGRRDVMSEFGHSGGSVLPGHAEVRT